MRYKKDEVTIENNNPVCDSLFIKQGWIPVLDEPVVEADTISNFDEENQQDEEVEKEATTGTEVNQDETIADAEVKLVDPVKKGNTKSNK